MPDEPFILSCWLFIFCKLLPFEKFRLLHLEINMPAGWEAETHRVRASRAAQKWGKMGTADIRVPSPTPGAHFASGPPQSLAPRLVHSFWSSGLLLRGLWNSMGLRHQTLASPRREAEIREL